MGIAELLLIGTAAIALGMAAAWTIARRIDNYGIVDIAWTASFTVLVAIYASLTAPPLPRMLAIAGIAAAWSLRLTIYLSRRVMRHHPVEDTRYQDLRRAWGIRLPSRMFWFFQAQALAAGFFSLPFAISLADPSPRLHPVSWLGIGLWAIGFAGEAAADLQLARFKADPANRGRICDAGLWRYSRHPNYFFEFIVWCGFAVVALGSPGGTLALACPAAMLWLLLRVTGIPATEAAALARRGDAYRRYQRATSAFVPWFPRDEARQP
jgi:steroid 5-alpha reductase family enzyme